MYLLQSTITDGIFIKQLDNSFIHYLIVDERTKATTFKTKEQARIAKKNLKYSHIHTKYFKIVEL